MGLMALVGSNLEIHVRACGDLPSLQSSHTYERVLFSDIDDN